MLERLSVALAGFRNREAAFALAMFLARFWSAPGRLVLAFPVDRRKLAGRADLGLSEDRIRGALASLEKIGFVAREAPVGRGVYQRTAAGLHRRPILFRFGAEYGEAFGRANARARTAQDARVRRKGVRVPAEPVRSPAGLLSHPRGPVPHKYHQAEAGLIMGECTAAERRAAEAALILMRAKAGEGSAMAVGPGLRVALMRGRLQS